MASAPIRSATARWIASCDRDPPGRTIIEVSKQHSPTGERYVTKPYLKDNEPRTFGVDHAWLEAVDLHIQTHGIGRDQPLFTTVAGTPETPSAPVSGCPPKDPTSKSVMERMGHAQIQTTQKYLHALPETDRKNLDALARARHAAPCRPAAVRDTRMTPSSPLSGGAAWLSRQREEQLLHLLDVDAVRTFAVCEALLEAGGDDGEAGPVQRSGDGCKLGDHVLAVAPLLHHAEYAGQLSLGALDAVDDRRHLRGVELH